MLTMKSLEEFEQRLTSGELEKEFKYALPERKYELLDLLEKLMDVAEKADEVASRIIFKDSALGAMMGMPQEDDEGDKS